MSSEIYYFSGTGNSFSVARDIAGKIDAELIPIASLLDKNEFSSKADTIGFVFPVYDFKAPKIMYEFVDKFNSLENKYLFAVATYGFTPQKTLEKFDEEVRKRQGKLASGFLAQMPKSGFGKKLNAKEEKEIFDIWDKRVDSICDVIKDKKEIKFDRINSFVHLILKGVLFKELAVFLPLIWYVMRHGWESLALNTDDKCNGCGVCVKICPTGNIKLVDGKPQWEDNCASCLGCLHWCPQEAVQTGGYGHKIKRYHHPDVSVSDMVNQNKR